MTVFQKYLLRCLAWGLCTLLPGIVLVACSGSSNATNSKTPTPPRSVTPYTPPASSVVLQTYKGKGFTIDYLQSWKVETASNTIAFKDALGVNALSITLVPNPGGTKSTKELADSTLLLLEATLTDAKTVSISPTATVDGKAWVQRSATGGVDGNGQSVPSQMILLVNNHPSRSSTTQAYEILYGGPDLTFEQTNRIFQTMLESFKFTT